VGVFLWSCSVFVTSIWTATIFEEGLEMDGSRFGTRSPSACHLLAELTADPLSLSANRLEACLFLPAWSASVPLAFAMIIQVILAWRGLPPPGPLSAERLDHNAPSFALARPREDMIESGVHQVAFEVGDDREKTMGQAQLAEEKNGKDEGLKK
jgi:hypothetical protein